MMKLCNTQEKRGVGMTKEWPVESEKDIENGILQYLNSLQGCFAFKYDVKGTWDPTRKFFRKVGKGVAIGGADLVGLYNGRFIAFEIKTPLAWKRFFKKPGEHELRQQAFLHQVRSKGGFAEVVCSIAMVEAHMKKFKNRLETCISRPGAVEAVQIFDK